MKGGSRIWMRPEVVRDLVRRAEVLPGLWPGHALNSRLVAAEEAVTQLRLPLVERSSVYDTPGRKPRRDPAAGRVRGPKGLRH